MCVGVCVCVGGGGWGQVLVHPFCSALLIGDGAIVWCADVLVSGACVVGVGVVLAHHTFIYLCTLTHYALMSPPFNGCACSD